MRNAALPALAVVLTLALAGCSDDDGTSGGEPSSAPSATSTAQAAYAVELALVEESSPPSGAPSSPSSSAGPSGGPLLVTVSNVGKRKDSYLLRLTPPDAGGVAPTTITLAPGEQEVVRVVLNTGMPGRETAPEVTALGRAQGEVLTTLELPG